MISALPKVTWFGVSRSPYNDFLLSEVNQQFDLMVYYKFDKIGTHPWQLQKTSYKNKAIRNNLSEALRRVRSSDLIVVSGWSYWQYLLVMIAPVRGLKKVYWTDTPSLKKEEWAGAKGMIRRLLTRIVFSVFDEVWSTGKPGCEALEKLGCKKAKIRSFPFFLDLKRYDDISNNKIAAAREFKLKNSSEGTRLVFLCIGQLATKKRFADAINAVAKTGNDNAMLWIAGTGPEQKNLQALAKSLRIEERVRFLGWLGQDDIESALIAADVFIHPAEFDPFPTVVLDAMTWGKPVIGTRESGSVTDRVRHGENGFIYNCSDVKALAGHIGFFLKNPERVAVYGASARKTAESYPVAAGIEQLKSVI